MQRDPSDNPTLLTPEYIDECRHPLIQRLKPQLDALDVVWTEADRVTFVEAIEKGVDRTEQIWLPTLDELLSMLRAKACQPNEPLLRPFEDGWECIVTIAEWTADYGTFVHAQRRFTGKALKHVLLRALKAAIGAGERWMVGESQSRYSAGQ